MKKIFTSIIILLLWGVSVNAQQAFTNSGNLQIHTGVSICGFGAFTNTSSGVLINNGDFYIKGNTTNDQASMTVGAGTLYLNGNTAQAVNGIQTFRTYNLVTNNAGGITLNNNLSIVGTHTFTDGIITTSATPNYLTYEAGSTYSGDGDTRHVNGWVKKIGNTDFIYPVGNGTVERTIALSNLSLSSEFNAKYFSNTPYANLMQIPLKDINNPEYWSINKISGGSAAVTMNWDYSKVYFPNWIVPDIVVAGYNGSLWVSNGGTAGGNAATTGTITSGSISSFNLFALGSQSFVVPLTLISFTANLQDNYTQIAWTTDNEYNMERYIVERSNDGTNFYPVTQLSPRNSSNTEHYYSRDYEPIQQIAYYRLRFKDINGSENLSKIVSVRVNTNPLLTLQSNPVHNKITLIATPSLKGLFHYRIMTMNGQLTQQGILLIQNGGSYRLDLKENFRPGAYTFEVTNGVDNFRYKVIVQ